MDTVNPDAKLQDEKAGDSLIYGIEDVPPWPSCIGLAVQQFLYCVGSLALWPVMLMPLICYEDSQNDEEYRTIIAGSTLLAAGIATFLQSTFGVRLPTLQGHSISYLVAMMSVLDSDIWKCPNEIVLRSSTPDACNYTGPILPELGVFGDGSNSSNAIKWYAENDGSCKTNKEVWMARMSMIQGSIIVCGIIQAIIGATGIVGIFIKYIGPLTIAPTMAMVTYSLRDLVIGLCEVHWGVAGITFAAFFIFAILMEKTAIRLPQYSLAKKRITLAEERYPIFALFSVLAALIIGLIVNFIIASATGSDSISNTMNQINSVPWFSIQYPFQQGWPTFSAPGILGLMIAIIPTTVEAIGHYVTTATVCQVQSPPTHAMNRGILFQGMGSVLYGILGVGSGTTTWTTNSVVICASKAASRRIVQIAGLIMIAVSCFTKSLSIFALMPEPVIGGLILGMVGTILSIGVASLKHVDMTKNRNITVFGISMFTAFVIPEFFTRNPDAIDLGSEQLTGTVTILLRSPMLIAASSGFILDNLSPGTKQERGLATYYGVAGEINGRADDRVYNLQYSSKCPGADQLPFCSTYKPKSCIKSC